MKSNKKLLAIVTLVMFMMTLLPMAAFAVDYSQTNTSLAASGLTVDDVYADAAHIVTANSALFTLTFRNSANAVLANSAVNFYVHTSEDVAVGWVEKDGVDSYTGGDQLFTSLVGKSNGEAVAATTDANGQVKVYFGAYVATTYDVDFWADEVDGSQIGKTKTVKVEEDAGAITLKAYEDDDDAALQIVYPTPVTAGEGFEIRADIGSAEDETVTFKQRINNGSWTVLGTDETDDDGIANFWVDTTGSGTYEFKATCGGDTSALLQVKVVAGEPDDVILKTAAGKIALDKSKSVEVYVKDEAGNLVKESGDTATDADAVGSKTAVYYEFISVPDGSEYEDADDYLVTNDRGIAKFSFTPDEIGTYTIKLKLDSDNGLAVGNDSETITFDCVDQGTITKLEFELDNLAGDVVPAVRYVEDSTAAEDPTAIALLKVKLVDADGVKITAAYTDVTLASSDPSVLTIDANNGELTVQDEDFTGPVTITATYGDDSIVGSYDVNVVSAPKTFTATPTVTDKKADVKLQLVDKDGKATVSTNGDFVDKEAINVIAPAGVTVSGIAKLDQAGAGGFTLTADNYGEYNITVTATVDNNAAGDGLNNTARAISKTFAVKFEQPAAEKPVTGAKTVTMFIGATGYVQDGAAKVADVAPFIQDGRTFVAVRPIAEAFGATAAWNEATQTVTLTRADMTLTIVIGQNTITKVVGGVTSTVTADVAAFIKDGRTVLPFRAVGEAFGATVSYDAATQAVSFAQ